MKDYLYTFNPKTYRRACLELITCDADSHNEFFIVESPMTKAGKIIESCRRTISYGFTPSYEDSKRHFEKKIPEGVIFASTRDELEASIKKWETPTGRDWKVMLELIR